MFLALFPDYVPFLLMVIISLIIGGAVLVISKVFGPSRPDPIKVSPYECGVDQLQPGARERYSIHFYLVAILFILFDLETVFLFPWAATFKDGVSPAAKVAMLVEILGFVAVLGLGLAYVWKRRGLEWD